MAFVGAKVVVFCGFLVNFIVNTNYFLFSVSTNSTSAYTSLTQGLILLFYPLTGWLADTCISRYKFIKLSTGLLAVASYLLFGYALILLLLGYFEVVQLIDPIPIYVMTIVLALIIVLMVSTGIFEAIIIQVGMDQMVEASSDQISKFIHWYYWSAHIGTGVQALVGFCMAMSLGLCNIELSDNINLDWRSTIIFFICILLPTLLLQFIFSTCAFLCLRCNKNRLVIEPAGHSSFSKVYSVLKYAWHHKCPENRSAFTYWEEDIPPRIDLGKSKYGGPFTTEEVEDVKTIFLLSALLLSLFGFHLADDGYSIRRQLHYKLCPSTIPLFATIISPNVLSSLTVLVSIPLFYFVIRPYFNRHVPNMLHRLGIGTVVVFFQTLAGLVIVLFLFVDYGSCSLIESRSIASQAPITDCVMSKLYFKIGNNCTRLRHKNYCGDGDFLFIALLILTAIHMLAYHLVFLTALEFISAQAPLKMKGLLISFWYALSAQRYVVQGITTTLVSEDRTWFFIQGVRGFLILLSVVLYSCIAKSYRYRLRDEVVNERYLIEEIYDRELQRAEEYERENREEIRAIHQHLLQTRCNL